MILLICKRYAKQHRMDCFWDGGPTRFFRKGLYSSAAFRYGLIPPKPVQVSLNLWQGRALAARSHLKNGYVGR